MGLFGSKTKYFVASQIYNLAGELDNKPNYMSSLTVQSAMIGDDIAGRLVKGIMQGPGSSLRNFQKWMNRNYQELTPEADITVDNVADAASIAPYVPIPSGSPTGTEVIIINAMITDPDTQIWTEKYLLENHPDLLNKEWTIEQDDIVRDITISFADDTPDIVFTPTNWNKGARYVAVRYALKYPGTTGSDAWQGNNFGPYRSLTAAGMDKYYAFSVDPVGTQSFSLVRKETVRTTYNDLRPNDEVVTETSVPVTHDYSRTEWRWDEPMGFITGTNTPQIRRHKRRVFDEKAIKTRYSRTTEEFSDRVVTTIVEQDELVDAFRYNYWIQPITGETISDQRVYIYRIGSGTPQLDNLEVAVATQREFFPMLPLRIDNKFIDEPEYEDLYEITSKAYKKAFGSKIDMMIDELKDNDQIDDLDFAFMVFGVTINDKDRAAKAYMYEFLKGLIPLQNSSKAEHDGYTAYVQSQAEAGINYNHYNELQRRKLGWEEDLAVIEAPVVPTYPQPRRTNFVLDSKIPELQDYKITISWSYIQETLGAGRGRAGAKKGDYWFTKKPHDPMEVSPYQNFQDQNLVMSVLYNSSVFNNTKKIYLYHQTSKLTYRRLEIVGLEQSNYVYANKSVVIQAYDEVNNNEEESGLFFPLHYPTMLNLSMKDQNQLSYSSRLLILNSYVRKKVRWYQRGIFKVIFSIAVIVISMMVMGPAGFASAPGILGTNMAVGAALGLSGMAAIIAGAVVNMVAAMVLTTVIQKASIELFGAKFGQIIGAIATFFAMKMGATYAKTGSLTMNWDKMFAPQNLLKLTESVSKGYTAFMQVKIEDLQEDYEKVSREYKDQLKVIEDRMNELYGNNLWIDPLLLTESTLAEDSSLRESSDSFLNRTLLTGTDIAEISLAMISEFPSATIKLPDAIG